MELTKAKKPFLYGLDVKSPENANYVSIDNIVIYTSVLVRHSLFFVLYNRLPNKNY